MMTGLPLLAVIVAAVLLVVLATSRWQVHPFLALLLASLGLALVVGLPAQDVIVAVNEGFGGLMAYIGIVVVLGSIIGVILERAGATQRIAMAILQWTGPNRVVLAMTLTGAVVGIPVFCDSGFVILYRLNRSLAQRAGIPRAQLTLGLAGGLYTTHTLVPPTPGPIAAAGIVGAADHLGYVMLLGLLIALPVGLVVWLMARWRGQQLHLPEEVEVAAEVETLPPLWQAAAPIGLPLLLITAGTLGNLLSLTGPGANVLFFLGNPLIALLLGTLAAFTLLPRWSLAQDWVRDGIAAAGPILVLTGAGGIFGSVLKATPIKSLLAQWLSEGTFTGAAFLAIAWLIAAFLKSAQGSSTSALIITASMLAPLTAVVGVSTPFALALLTLAIGGGAMTVSHANDSFFWVVSQFSGLSLRQAIGSYTLMTLAQGLTVLAMVLLLHVLVG
jgi:GntP family gluconate:H+ symporter